MAARSDDEIEELMTPPVFTPSVPCEISLQEEEGRHDHDSEEENESEQSGFDIEDFTRRHLFCPKCGQYYKDPITLPCLDTYCKDCVENMARQKREELLRQEEEEEEERLDSDNDRYFESLRSSFNLTPTCSLSGEERETEPVLENKHIDINNFYCPQGCQATTGIKVEEDGRVYDLPSCNLFLQNLINTIRLKEELPTGRMWCKNCDTKSIAVAVCNNEDCANLPLCVKCLEAHIIGRFTKEHRIICASTSTKQVIGGHRNGSHGNGRHGDGFYGDSSVSRGDGSHGDGSHGDGSHGDGSHGDGSHGDGSQGNPEEPPDEWKNFDRRSWHCHYHPQCLVDSYCYNHEVTICRDCKLDADYHWNCRNIRNTNNCMDEEIKLLDARLEEVDKVHEEFKVALENLKKMKTTLAIDKDWIINDITERCNNLTDNINQQRIELVRKTTRLYNSKLTHVHFHQERLERISNTFTRSLEFIRGTKVMAIPTEFMFLKESFHDRLCYLLNTYREHYQLPSDLNNRIYFRPNEGFNTQEAIGQVRGTPFIEEFTLEVFPPNLQARRTYPFEIKCRDICKAPLEGVSLPHLRATITRDNEEPIDCYVHPNTNKGTYVVYMFPAAPGHHEISVFNAQNGPLENLFIKGFPVSVNVGP